MGSGACLCLGIAGDPGKQATQFDGDRQINLSIEDGADCIGLGDEEYPKSMVTSCPAGNRRGREMFSVRPRPESSGAT